MSSLFYIWEFTSRHPGIVFVFVGVFGEIALEWRHATGREVWLKKTCWAFLVLGLMMEFVEAAKSDKDVAELNRLAGAANERAADVESTNLALRAKVLELEAKMMPRRITIEQMHNFKLLTEHIAKTPIKIISVKRSEPLTFAHDLREMFSYAGFPTNADVEMFGLNSTEGEIIGLSPGRRDAGVWFVDEHVNEPHYAETNWFTCVWNKDLNCPIVSTTNQIPVYMALSYCFTQIGIAYWPNRFPSLRPGSEPYSWSISQTDYI